MTPRIIWLAKTDVDAYANPTEPTLYPHGFTELVEKKYYDELERRIEQMNRECISLFLHEQRIKDLESIGWHCHNHHFEGHPLGTEIKTELRKRLENK